MIYHMTSQNYHELIGQGLPVIVDFQADWCGACRAMDPLFRRLSAEYEGRAVFARVDVDREPGLTRRFRVSSIPTFIILQDHAVVKTFLGVQSRERLMSAMGLK